MYASFECSLPQSDPPDFQWIADGQGTGFIVMKLRQIKKCENEWSVCHAVPFATTRPTKSRRRETIDMTKNKKKWMGTNEVPSKYYIFCFILTMHKS
jgi:hypothetical protein